MNQFPFYYLERDGGNVEIFGGKAIAQLLDSAGDLVKVHSLRPGQDVMCWCDHLHIVGIQKGLPSVSFEHNHLASGCLRHLYLLFAGARARVQSATKILVSHECGGVVGLIRVCSILMTT